MNVITDIASQGLTRALAEQARTLTYADLPDEVRALARQCVLDYVACTLAGAKEELTDILLAEMSEQGGTPAATVIGHDVRLPVLSAALVNGAASHALDFDDVNLAMTGHPTVVLLSSLLAKLSTATSTSTVPFFISFSMSRVMSLGAAWPGMRMPPITRSAPVQYSSIAPAVE